MIWRPTNAVSGDITNKWKGDEDLTRHLTFSIAEGSQKLNEFFKQHKEKPSRYYLDYQKAVHLIW